MLTEISSLFPLTLCIPPPSPIECLSVTSPPFPSPTYLESYRQLLDISERGSRKQKLESQNALWMNQLDGGWMPFPTHIFHSPLPFSPQNCSGRSVIDCPGWVINHIGRLCKVHQNERRTRTKKVNGGVFIANLMIREDLSILCSLGLKSVCEAAAPLATAFLQHTRALLTSFQR